MPQPRLLHPVAVTIEPLSNDGQLEDENLREEIQIVGRSEQIVISAQMEYRDKDDYASAREMFDARGLVIQVSGYFLVRTLDAQLQSWTPQIGDRLVETGTGSSFPQQLDCVVTKIEPRAHYPGLGATLLKCFFGDRKPSHG